MIAKKIILITIFLLTIFGMTGGYFFYQKDRKLKNKIYPNVFIDNINFGGKTKDEVLNYFSAKNNQLLLINLFIVYKDDPIASFSAKKLGFAYDASGVADRAFLIGRSSHFPSKIYQKIAAIVNWQRFEFQSRINFDRSLIEEAISSIEEKYDKPARNALFKFERGKVISFRQEEKGQKLDSQKFYQEIETAAQNLKEKPQDIKIRLSIVTIEPEITLGQANNFGIEEEIGVGKSDFTGSARERVHNIILASSKFNGVFIPKNKIFSFNEAVGDISSLTGYQPAYIIKEGKTVLGDGGGVCQVSTTLFRAALNAGLSIIERTAHAYRVSYYENDSRPGFDATVFAPSVDLKIKNDTPAYILIETEVDEEKNLLYFKFFGKKDERKTEIFNVSLWDVAPPPPPKYQDDPILKKGVIKQIDFPAWGGKASFDYKVIKDEKTIFEKKFFSFYRPWQAVYLQGTAD